ncbi:polysaccharide deacetylase family protein [Sporolituus thermophilus]|uniref:Peptidoglycan/xylan/chitin deacetylase, PgdA/CDA1 family n=1 Tax=Sporolituus thermophilus DSM 23256 TaxID=1123285 RepID=A0A1G7J485_9FIRM|nr:polysaccharide deacetylase family protein [Sporolituus thermophilus]SDF19329.1 Peptidoglycan/xylan/chitin deacetylase, PgdA/CDA1 family [Sporolituus thermophilus DSM 23256]
MKRFILVFGFLMAVVFTQTGTAAPPVVDGWPVTSPVVALTVENIETAPELESILNLCRDEGIAATLFIREPVISAQAALVKKGVALGLEFGNYGRERRYWAEVSSGDIAKELADAAKALETAAGKAPQVVRPPFYYYEDNFLQAVEQYDRGAVVVRGLDTGDWTLMSPQAVTEFVITSAKAGTVINVNIKAPHAAAALPEVVKQLKAKGFKITTVAALKAAAKPAAPPASSAKSSGQHGLYAVVNSGRADRPLVALTFDDGGSYYQVREILDVLREYNARSTFFLLGRWVDANPELTRRILADGHEIANHSYSHPSFSRLSADEMRSEIMSTQYALERAVGSRYTHLFRPPYGDYNGTLSAVLNGMGYRALVMWNVDSRDWTGVSAWSMANKILSQVSGGAIILFHLHGSNTADALRTILPELRARGYNPVTVTELLAG